MADRAKKISELTAANTAANTDYLLIVTNTAGTAVTKRINFANVAASVFATGGGNTVLTIGNTTINGRLTTTGNTVAAQVNATSLNIGANVVVTTSGISVGNSTVNTSANSTTLSVVNVLILSGSASTRLGVNTEIGSTGSNGSIYLSTAGKIYLKVANTGVATDDWQRVTTTAVD